MSAPKGIRLWLRPAWKDHKATWIIRDGSRQRSTGCSAIEIEQANEALAAYIAEKYRPENKSNRPLSDIAVSDVLISYLDGKAKAHARPNETMARISHLERFFGAMTLAEINNLACREYARLRSSSQSARRELEDLRAAIRDYFSDRVIAPNVKIEMPPKASPRERWLTVSEAAILLRAAWRRNQIVPSSGARRYTARHVARFILVGLYTGTRSARICAAAIRPTVGRGYVDLDRGVFYRRPPGSEETKKRQPPVRLPEKLLNHIRRWSRLGLCERCIVEWEGQPVRRVSGAFRKVADGVGLFDVSPHTLRHTAITWALQAGAKPFDVSDFFGVSEEVIRETYGHHSPEHHKEVTARLDKRLVSQPVSGVNNTKLRIAKK